MFCRKVLSGFTVVGFLIVCQSFGQTQQPATQKDSIQVVDSVTKETIPELLLIPLYSVARGAIVIPEGPGKLSKETYYFGNPIKYRTGDKFPIKRDESFSGLPLLFAYVGKFTSFEGVLTVVPGYRPYFCKEYACLNFSPRFELTKVTDDVWTKLLNSELKPLVDKSSKIIEHCFMFGLQEKCKVKTKFDKKSRELTRSFLQKQVPKSK